jgi:hypothetical protein
MDAPAGCRLFPFPGVFAEQKLRKAKIRMDADFRPRKG